MIDNINLCETRDVDLLWEIADKVNEMIDVINELEQKCKKNAKKNKKRQEIK